MDDLTFRLPGGKFNLRVAGVILKDDELLVMSDNGLPYFYLPGGRVQLQESSEAAIRREIVEELSEELQAVELLWVVENFFYEKQQDADFHEVCFFYRCQLRQDSPVFNHASFTTLEPGRTNRFQWVRIEDLDRHVVLPRFLKQRLLDPKPGVQHFVFDDDARP